jgi:hypothetical protein
VKARFSYVIQMWHGEWYENRVVMGFDKLDALENARFLYPGADTYVVSEEEYAA